MGTHGFAQGSQWVLHHGAIPFFKVHADVTDASQVAHRAWRKGEEFNLILLHPGAKRDELGLKQPFSFTAILSKRSLFFCMTHYLLIQASAGAAGVCSLYCIAQTVMVSALCFLSQKWADFSSCKINIFHYRVTQSAEPESILVLLGLKCGFPQIFQESESTKSGHVPLLFPGKHPCYLHTGYALLCFSDAFSLWSPPYHLSFSVPP